MTRLIGPRSGVLAYRPAEERPAAMKRARLKREAAAVRKRAKQRKKKWAAIAAGHEKEKIDLEKAKVRDAKKAVRAKVKDERRLNRQMEQEFRRQGVPMRTGTINTVDPKPPDPQKDRIRAYGSFYPRGTHPIAIELDQYLQTPLGDQKEFHFRQAWGMLWPKFEHNEWTDVIVWAWCHFREIVIIGHQRASKTYTVSFCVILDYLAAPTVTLTSVSTVTLEGLRLRMWSDIGKALESWPANLPQPFEVRSTTNEYRIFPIEFKGGALQKYQIHGMAVSRTSDAAGRIRGGHADRRRIILDEAQEMPQVIYDALVNPMSAPDPKAVILSNPVERQSELGRRCEPEGGWPTFDEAQLWWKTKKGGVCIRFDGLRSPNIKAGKTIFPYLLTQQSIDDIVNAHGRDSVQFYSLVRGLFPPDGMVAKIFPSATIERGIKEIVFDFQPQWCASLDPAFEFDNCALHWAHLAQPIFGERDYRINAKETEVFKFDASPGSEPKDYQIAHWIMIEARRRGLKPEHFIMDATGNARGVVAILQKEWSRDFQVVEYGGPASDRALRADDSRKCCDLYKWYVTELWFRAAEYTKAGFIGGLGNLDTRTVEDLSSRRYELKQGTHGFLMQAESKREMKGRIDRSPDFGDAYCQFGELLYRLGTVPGGGVMYRLQSRNKWAKQRERAQTVNARHSEAAEFSY